MEKFNILEATAAPLELINIDTDMIIPKQFLKTIKRTGLGKNLFHEMRYDLDGKEIADFILNADDYKNSKILVTGDNFGCGSSREHAPWALLDFGIKCIIAPSFADIFYNNCFKNGILPIKLDNDKVSELKVSTHSEVRTVLAPPFHASIADIAYGFKGKPYKGTESICLIIWSMQYPSNGRL